MKGFMLGQRCSSADAWLCRRSRRAIREAMRGQSGQALPLVAGLAVVLVLFAALAINIGEWYDTDSGLQKAVDLSAIAGAQYLATNGSLTTAGYPCTVAAGVTTAVGCAQVVAGLNGMSGAESATASQITVNGNQAIKVVTTHPNESGIFFNSTRQESATAIVGGLAGAGNPFPATFQQQLWVPGTQVNFVFGTAQVPGAFNLVQACGSNGGGGSPSEQQLITCFKCTQTYTIDQTSNSLVPNPLPNSCGTVSPLCTGNTVASDPGNNLNNNVINAINGTLSGQVVLIPAYDTTQGSGNNATFHVVGFAEMHLANPAAQQVGSGNNKSVEITGTFIQELAPSDVQGPCTGTGENFGALTYFLVS
jgi:putative Flp pilus-assembly TadE/G-like protein